MERLLEHDVVAVMQKKEWGEILTGFEGVNKYVVLDSGGNELYAAIEEGGNFFLRLWLKALRPFEISIRDWAGEQLLRIKRPFRFYFHEVEIYGGGGEMLGRVVRKFSWLRRVYSVLDANGGELFELFGPLLHPWTFEIRQDGRAVGMITKKWSSIGKEMFSDADNFGIEFPGGSDVQVRSVLMGAVFLIDFAHFENKGDD